MLPKNKADARYMEGLYTPDSVGNDKTNQSPKRETSMSTAMAQMRLWILEGPNAPGSSNMLKVWKGGVDAVGDDVGVVVHDDGYTSERDGSNEEAEACTTREMAATSTLKFD